MLDISNKKIPTRAADNNIATNIQGTDIATDIANVLQRYCY